MIKMVVFDMAGTVINEDNVVYKTLQKAIGQAGYPLSLEQVLEVGAGQEKFQAIRSILEVFENVRDEVLAESIYRNFTELLEGAYETQTVFPQDGALELFRQLDARKIKVVLNTGYSSHIANLLLEKLGWKKDREYNDLITAGDVQQNRPNPDMIFLAMSRAGISEAATVAKVGDSIIDIQEGQNAGCGLSIGITTGAHTRAQLLSAGPNQVIDHLSELIPLLE